MPEHLQIACTYVVAPNHFDLAGSLDRRQKPNAFQGPLTIVQFKDPDILAARECRSPASEIPANFAHRAALSIH